MFFTPHHKLTRVAVAGPLAAIFASVAIGLFVWAQPALAALACPSCLGFERQAGKLFVDAAMPADQRTTVETALKTGEERVAKFYGRLRESPVILACASDACDRRLAKDI